MRRFQWKLPVTGLICCGLLWSAASADPRSLKRTKPTPTRTTPAEKKSAVKPIAPEADDEVPSSDETVDGKRPRTGLLPPEDSLAVEPPVAEDSGPVDEAIIDRLLAAEGLSPIKPKSGNGHRTGIIPAGAEIPANDDTATQEYKRHKNKPAAPKSQKTVDSPAAPRRMPVAGWMEARPVSNGSATPLSSAAPRNTQRVPTHEEIPAPPAGQVILPMSGTRVDEHVIPADYNAPPEAVNGAKPVSEIELAGYKKPRAGLTASPIATADEAAPRRKPRVRQTGHEGVAPPIAGGDELPAIGPALETSTEIADVAAPPPPPSRRASARRVKQTSASPTSTEEQGGLVQAVGQGGPQTPSIKLRWITDGAVNVGQPCKCGLVVKNDGSSDAHDIVVEAAFPKTVRVLETSPAPRIVRDKLAWKFADFPAGEERTIEITMIPYKKGELATSASVRFTGTASTVLRVEEPELAVSLKGPQEAMLGETLSQLLSVSNSGSGVANEVVLHVALPPGLEHPRGKRLEMPVGTLGAGETREVRLSLTAVAGGDQQILVEARSGQNLVRQAETTVQITSPKLQVKMQGPTLRYVDRQAQYTVTVANVGAVATDNVRVQLQIAPGFDFVKAERGARHDWSTRQVTWFLGRMEMNQTAELPVTLVARQGGTHHHEVTVTDEVGGTSQGSCETRVESTSAIVMEVVDLDDPVEVGAETAYEIRIRNDGSKAAKDLNVSFDIPTGVELLETQGPTTARRSKNGLAFKTLETLGPKQKVAYRVFITGHQAGNLRCRAKLTTGTSTEPLVVEEQTKFYAD